MSSLTLDFPWALFWSPRYLDYIFIKDALSNMTIINGTDFYEASSSAYCPYFKNGSISFQDVGFSDSSVMSVALEFSTSILSNDATLLSWGIEMKPDTNGNGSLLYNLVCVINITSMRL